MVENNVWVDGKDVVSIDVEAGDGDGEYYYGRKFRRQPHN